MNSQNIAKFIIGTMVTGVLVVYCNKAWAQDGYNPRGRYTPPPNVLPLPQPPQQLPQQQPWPEASFYKWVSKDVIREFKNNGLEVKDVKPGYTVGTLTPREGTIFLIPSFGKDIGGYASSYNTEKDLKKMKKNYIKMNKNTESPAWWIFEKDNILLLISGKVPEEKARHYEKVLYEMDKPR